MGGLQQRLGRRLKIRLQRLRSRHQISSTLNLFAQVCDRSRRHSQRQRGRLIAAGRGAGCQRGQRILYRARHTIFLRNKYVLQIHSPGMRLRKRDQIKSRINRHALGISTHQRQNLSRKLCAWIRRPVIQTSPHQQQLCIVGPRHPRTKTIQQKPAFAHFCHQHGLAQMLTAGGQVRDPHRGSSFATNQPRQTPLHQLLIGRNSHSLESSDPLSQNEGAGQTSLAHLQIRQRQIMHGPAHTALIGRHKPSIHPRLGHPRQLIARPRQTVIPRGGQLRIAIGGQVLAKIHKGFVIDCFNHPTFYSFKHSRMICTGCNATRPVPSAI